jgi:alkanesulfonate monooxygenase SsuD/methylene tetrahydromethanopterin reductase-like flavin-dependent oxidoreductase (luciferase family)
VILHAGSSERSRQFAAREADVIFAGVTTLAQGRQYASEIRCRATESGRDPDDIAILPGLTPLVGATLDEAREIYDELNSLIILDEDVRFGGREPRAWTLGTDGSRTSSEGVPLGYRNLGALSLRLGVDVTAESLDAAVPLEIERAFTSAGNQLVLSAAERTGRTVGLSLTWRDVLYTYIVGGHVVVGGPTEIADYIESWHTAGASDGFNIQSAFLDQQFDAFVDLVVPELRRRGLFRSEYEGSTLREHLGLARPRSRFTLDQRVEVSS